MSFILDALRKSETERQRQSGPGLVDAGLRRPARRRGFWLPALLTVLAANLVVMAYLWQREPQPGAPTPAAAPAAGTVAPPAAAERPAPQPAGSTLATTAESEYAAMADLPAVEAEPAAATLEPPVSTGSAPESAASGPAASYIVRDAIPSAEQLIATGALSGAAMHLDIHVYNSDPAERFVFINMRKYTEGTRLPDGPQLEEITPEGAIFSINGQRFQLARD